MDKSGYVKMSATKRFKPGTSVQFQAKHLKYVAELKLWVEDLLEIKPDPDNEEGEPKLYRFRSTFVHMVNIIGGIAKASKNNLGDSYVVDDGSDGILCWMDRDLLIKRKRVGIPTEEKLAQIEERHCRPQVTDSSTCNNSLTAERASASAAVLKVAYWLAEKIVTKLESTGRYVNRFEEGDFVQVRGKLDDLGGERCVMVEDIRLITNYRELADRRSELLLLYKRLYGPKQPP